MRPKRISIKFFCAEDSAGDLSAAIGLFHGFIQNQAVEGLLVDVADYIHVPEGPGVILVGHDIEYALDSTDGRPGLLTTSKRIEAIDLADSVRTTLRRALVAISAIEDDGSIGARFDTAAFELRILDRLEGPNDALSYDTAQKELAAILSFIPGGKAFSCVRSGEEVPRQALAVSAQANKALDVPIVIETLGGIQQGPSPSKAQSPWDISVEELARLRDSGACFELVDVREADEYERCNLGGRLVPLGELPGRMSELEKDSHVVVHCKMGGRGAKATQTLRDAGFENAWNVRGGLAAWVERVDPSLELD